MKRYPIPAARVRVEQVISRSRFIATAGMAETPDAARAFIAGVAGELPDATHHCYAYVAGAPGSTAHIGMSDGGEPPGTAGRPMLAVLLGSGVGDVVVVVSRYFGGIKLGTGGLVRAYSGAVKAALAQMPLATKVARRTLRVRMPYAHVSAVERLLPEFEAWISACDYAADVVCDIAVPGESAEGLARALADLGRGTISVTEQEEGQSPQGSASAKGGWPEAM